jgi:hypothetical protein
MADAPQTPASTSRRFPSPTFLVILALVPVIAVAASYYQRALRVKNNPIVPAPGEVAKRSVIEARKLLEGTEHSPVTFFRIDPHSGNPGDKARRGPFLRDWTILQEKSLDAKTIEDVRSILTREGSYSDCGARCFDPGLGFRFKRGGSDVDLVICLDCLWVHAYAGDERTIWALSRSGAERLMGIYKTQAAPDPK